MYDFKKIILVVDDEECIRDALGQFLTIEYVVLTAESIDEARRKLDYIKFDIVLLDIGISGDSHSFVMDKGKDNNIILVTGYTLDEFLPWGDKCLNDGLKRCNIIEEGKSRCELIDGIMLKPFGLPELCNLIRNVIEENRKGIINGDSNAS